MKRMLILVLLLVGCSNDEAYHTALQKGLDEVASDAYQKAEVAFELALEEKPKDTYAQALLTQVKALQEALSAFKNVQYDEAKRAAEQVTAITNGADSLVKRANALIEEVEGEQQQQQKRAQAIDQVNDLIAKKQYNEAKEALVALEGDSSEEVQQLTKQVDDALANIEKQKQQAAQAEKERLAQIEQQRQEAIERERQAFTGERAAEIALSHYGSEDTGATYIDELLPNEFGSYYQVTLYSKSMRAQGGSGTLMHVKVYQDGTIEEVGY